MTGGISALQGGAGVNNGIMRLFVAIGLPPEAASELDEVVAPLRPNWPDLRWTGRDAWHLTLAFLGEVDETVIARLAVRMERAARRHPCLSLTQFEEGSSGRMARDIAQVAPRHGWQPLSGRDHLHFRESLQCPPHLNPATYTKTVASAACWAPHVVTFLVRPWKECRRLTFGKGTMNCGTSPNLRGFGCYTDDTQMTLALATSLVEKGIADPEDISLKYAEFYEPRRGYGSAAHKVMGALLNGADYRQTGRMEFPNGSFGNGGAMRIAPIGLAYRHASDEVLRQAVDGALLCTHVHSEAIDGAFIQAKAVAMLATAADCTGFDRRQLVETLIGESRTFVIQRKLEILLEQLGGRLQTTK